MGGRVGGRCWRLKLWGLLGCAGILRRGRLDEQTRLITLATINYLAVCTTLDTAIFYRSYSLRGGGIRYCKGGFRGLMKRRKLTKRERALLSLTFNGKCSICGEELPQSWHADHIEAFSRTGRTNIFEMQATCPRCNLKKGSK